MVECLKFGNSFIDGVVTDNNCTELEATEMAIKELKTTIDPDVPQDFYTIKSGIPKKIKSVTIISDYRVSINFEDFKFEIGNEDWVTIGRPGPGDSVEIAMRITTKRWKNRP